MPTAENVQLASRFKQIQPLLVNMIDNNAEFVSWTQKQTNTGYRLPLEAFSREARRLFADPALSQLYDELIHLFRTLADEPRAEAFLAEILDQHPGLATFYQAHIEELESIHQAYVHDQLQAQARRGGQAQQATPTVVNEEGTPSPKAKEIAEKIQAIERLAHGKPGFHRQLNQWLDLEDNLEFKSRADAINQQRMQLMQNQALKEALSLIGPLLDRVVDQPEVVDQVAHIIDSNPELAHYFETTLSDIEAMYQAFITSPAQRLTQPPENVADIGHADLVVEGETVVPTADLMRPPVQPLSDSQIKEMHSIFVRKVKTEVESFNQALDEGSSAIRKVKTNPLDYSPDKSLNSLELMDGQLPPQGPNGVKAEVSHGLKITMPKNTEHSMDMMKCMLKNYAESQPVNAPPVIYNIKAKDEATARAALESLRGTPGITIGNILVKNQTSHQFEARDDLKSILQSPRVDEQVRRRTGPGAER